MTCISYALARTALAVATDAACRDAVPILVMHTLAGNQRRCKRLLCLCDGEHLSGGRGCEQTSLADGCRQGSVHQAHEQGTRPRVTNRQYPHHRAHLHTIIARAPTRVSHTQPWGVAASGSHAYVTGYTSSSLAVLDITNPAHPSIVGSVASSTHMDGVLSGA
jgi:hypothetical protein